MQLDPIYNRKEKLDLSHSGNRVTIYTFVEDLNHDRQMYSLEYKNNVK